MITYRIFFRDEDGRIVGRDDFDAEDDAHARVIARVLLDACSDACVSFDLWEGTRIIVGKASAKPGTLTVEQVSARVQMSVLEREMAIRDSQWHIAESARL